MLKRRLIKHQLRGLLLGILSLCALLGGVSAVGAEPAIKTPWGLSALGQPVAMPSFNLPTADGGTVDSATLQGKVVIVRFWATW